MYSRRFDVRPCIEDNIRHKFDLDSLKVMLSGFSAEEIREKINANKPGDTPLLHLAIYRPELVTYLLELGAQPCKDRNCFMPARLAVLMEQWTTAELLIDVDIKTHQQFSPEFIRESDYKDALCAAVINNKYEIVEKLLRAGVTDCDSAYQSAIKSDNVKMIELLLKYNVPLPSIVLHSAVLNTQPNRAVIVRQLVLAGADLTVCVSDKTPIETASAAKAWDIVKVMAETRPDKDGRAYYASALFDVVITKDVPDRYELMECLLKANAKTTRYICETSTGYYSIHKAAELHDEKAIRLFCDYGADPETGSRVETHIILKTPAQVAAENQAFEAFEVLVQHMAIKKAKAAGNAQRLDHVALMYQFIEENSKLFAGDNSLALHWAVKRGHRALVPLLLQLAESHPKQALMQDKQGKTSLELVIAKQDWELLRAFAKSGVKVHVGLGLSKAAEANELKTVICLLDAGAPWNFTDAKTGFQAMDWAIRHDNVQMVRALLSKGASVYLALPLAAEHGSIEMMELLLQQPINLAHLNQSNENAFQIAVRKQHWVVAERIMQAQEKAQLLSPTQVSTVGLDASLLGAVQGGRADMVRILLDLKAPMTALSVDGYCVADWMFHADKPDISIAQLIFAQSSSVERWKFLAKCYDLIAQNKAPAWLLQHNVLQVIFPDLELPTEHYFRKEALGLLLSAIQTDSREALAYLETELAAPQKRNDRHAQIALANLCMQGHGQLIPVDMQRVAYWAFQDLTLDKAGQDFFRDKEVRSHLSNAHIIKLYVRNFFNAGEIASERNHGLLEGITDEDIDCEFVNSPNLWLNRFDFIFTIFEKATTQAMLSEQEKADFLLQAMLTYPTHEKVRNDFAKHINQLTNNELLAGLTNTYFILSLLNKDPLTPDMLAFTKSLTLKLATKILCTFAPHYAELPLQRALDVLKLLLSIVSQDQHAKLQIHVTDISTAAQVFNLIEKDKNITNKYAVKSALRAAAFLKLKETIALYPSETRLQLLHAMKEENLFKEPVVVASLLGSLSFLALRGAPITPEVQAMDSMIAAIEFDRRAVVNQG